MHCTGKAPAVRGPAPNIALAAAIMTLSVLALSSLVVPGQAWADAVPADEIGQPADGPSVKIKPIEPDLELALGVDYTHLASRDENNTYTGMPGLAATVSAAIGKSTRFFLASGYSRTTGDPYYDLDGDFGDSESTLKLIPVTLGLRINAAQNARARFNLEMALAFGWVQETLPGEASAYYDPRASGMINGFSLAFGPEFPLNGNASRWLGLEMGWRSLKADLGDSDREIDLSGWQARAYYGVRL